MSLKSMNLTVISFKIDFIILYVVGRYVVFLCLFSLGSSFVIIWYVEDRF